MDGRLAQRCREGDPDAFADLVAVTGQLTYRWAHRLAGNRDDALDMVLGAVLAVTVIGAPLALALGLSTMAALILGAAAVSDVAGTRLLTALGKSGGPPLLRTMAGAAGLGLLLFVPVLGWLLLAAAALAGLGASAGIWYPRLAPAWRRWRDRRRAGNRGDQPGGGGGARADDDGPDPGGV